MIDRAADLRLRGWLVVLLLTANFLINFLDKSVIGLSAVAIMTELHLSPTRFGLMNSAFFLLFVPTQLIGGMLADRWRSKTIALLMALIWSLAMLLPLALPALFATFLVSRMILGFGEGPFTPVAIHAIYKWFAVDKRAVPNAVLNMGGPLAMIGLLPYLVRLIERSGWRAAFMVLGLASLVWALCWQLLGAEGQEAVPGGAAPRRFSLPAYWRVMRSRTFLGCTLVGFPSFFALTLIFVWVPRFLERGLGLSAVASGWIIDISWGTICLGSLLVSLASQTMLARGVSMRVSVGVLAPTLLGLGGIALLCADRLFDSVGQGALVAAAFAVVVVSNPLLFTALGRLSPVQLRGGVIGIFGACTTCAGLLAPVAMGMTIDYVGQERAGFVLGFNGFAVVAVVCSVVAALLINPEADAARFEASGDVATAMTALSESPMNATQAPVQG